MAAAAAVPVGFLLWPSASEPLALDPGSGMGQVQRDVPLGRGTERTMPPDLESPTASNPTATIEASPTPTPTKKPKPAPTKSPTPTKTPEPEPEPEPTATGEMYVTTALNVRTEPSTGAGIVTVLERGAEVPITGETDDEWVEIIYDGEAMWVSGAYLSEEEPAETEEPEDGISYEECESGSEVESGLTPDAIRVHRAVCHEFPDVDSYGGLRSGDGGEHGTGQALDIMVSSSSLGDVIASWVREHYAELGVSEIIWAQKIWTVERANEGWRWMEDRGSPTANHYDHVHVTVYGDSGG